MLSSPGVPQLQARVTPAKGAESAGDSDTGIQTELHMGTGAAVTATPVAPEGDEGLAVRAARSESQAHE